MVQMLSDKARLTLGALLLGAAFLACSWSWHWTWSAGAVCLLVPISILLVWPTKVMLGFRSFVGDTRKELYRVTWPARQEVVRTTMVIVVIVSIVSALLWGIDSLVMLAVAFLTGQKW